MKSGVDKFIKLFFIIAFILLSSVFTACSSGGGSAQLGGSSNNLGTLPNGSVVTISSNNYEISAGTASSNATLSISGGTPGSSFTFSFIAQNSATSTALKPHDGNKTIASNLQDGQQQINSISVNTTPSPCVVTSGSKSLSCTINISVSRTTPDGTYTITPTAQDNSTQSSTTLGTITVKVKGAKAITAYSINNVPGVINGANISLTLPFGTNAESLIATFTTTGVSVKAESIEQISGTTSVNFIHPVIYTVTAADGSLTEYVVNVTVVSSESANAITSYSLSTPNGQLAGIGTIVGESITVNTIPYGTDITQLIATFVTTGASVKIESIAQVSGITINDFTNPLTYSVTAADDSIRNYTVYVTVAPPTAKALTSYSLFGAQGIIDEQNKTITVTLPYDVDLSSRIATFDTTGVNVKVGTTQQFSGVTPNNFTTPVIYTVTAADDSTTNYTVTVKRAALITSFSILGFPGVISNSAHTINVRLPYPTDMSALVASFTTTANAASVTVNGVTQTSSVTPNNFGDPLSLEESPVTYTIVANNGSTFDYIVSLNFEFVPSLFGAALNSNATFALILYRYGLSQSDGGLIRCHVNESGNLSNCYAMPNLGFNEPYSVVISSTGAFALVTANNQLFTCSITDGNGTIGSCTNNNNSISNTYTVTLDSTSTHAFTVNFDGSISYCNVNGSGVVSGCITTAPSFAAPDGIVLNPLENFAYISTEVSDVYSCGVDTGSIGILNNCGTTGPSPLPDGAYSMVLSSNGLFAYIRSSDDPPLLTCNVDNNTGQISSNCNSTTSDVGLFIAVGPVTNYLLIATTSTFPRASLMSHCNITESGATVNCELTYLPFHY